MQYSSSNGCLFYYDRVLYSWQIAEPTMLFLLGIEAVTSYYSSTSDTLTLSKYAYYSNVGDVEPLEHFSEVYDDIYNFLSHTNRVDDYEDYIKFNCNGLKLLLNELTGTGDDRTVPIIFKNDINKPLIDLSTKMYRIPESDYIKKTQWDLQAQKIQDIFNDACYNKSKSELDLISLDGITDTALKNAVASYNTSMLNASNERKNNSNIFYLFDYKAMYSYALGVLYGCLCMGYDYKSVWRINPKVWYKGKFKNLVSTAWAVFRFHFTDYISDIDDDPVKANKYKGIQLNKIWNFENTSDGGFTPLAKDEQLLYGLSVQSDNRTIYIDAVNYTRYSELDEKGAYLLENRDGTSSWHQITDKISSDTPSGLVSDNDPIITRYLAYAPISIRKAYCYSHSAEHPEEDGYLSPTDTKKYFVITGSAGWTDVDFNSNENIVTGANTLSFVPYSLNTTDTIKVLRNNNNNRLVACYPSSRDEAADEFDSIIYGIFNSGFAYEDGRYVLLNSTKKFDSIVSKEYILSNYTLVDEISPGYKLSPYYNIDSVAYLYVDDTGTYLYDGGEEDPPLIAYFGYTRSRSTALDAYNGFNSETHIPSKIDLRYNSGYYWSSTWLNPEEDNKHTYNPWQASIEGENIYIKSGIISLFKGLTQVADTIPSYITGVSNQVSHIFNDTSITDVSEGFISLSDLRSVGITPYRCTYVLQDDNGNYLTSDGTPNGTPLVWYDSSDDIEERYWNGLLDPPLWQESKPSVS